VLGIERVSPPRQPFQPGGERAALWQTLCLLTTDGAEAAPLARCHARARGFGANGSLLPPMAAYSAFSVDSGMYFKVYVVAATGNRVYTEFTHNKTEGDLADSRAERELF
jgi:hypothetical protein